MRSKIFSLLLILLGVCSAKGQNYTSAVPAQCPDVMLQGFYWDSYKVQSGSDSKYGRTKWIDWLNKTVEDSVTTRAEEVAQWFELIWLPPSASSTGGVGYYPSCMSNQDSNWGTRTKLAQLIDTLHAGGAKVLADIVINHRGNKSSWVDFYQDNFGSYGTFQLTQEHICSDDEAFTSSVSPYQGSSTHGAADTGTNDDGCRDLDHTSEYVQSWSKAYVQWMINVMKYDGFRYDMTLGYHGQYLNMYNEAASPYFSVSELWSDINTLVNHLQATNYNTLIFDYPLKNTLNSVFQDNTYSALYNSTNSLRKRGYSRYAVTFIDNHDTFERADNQNSEFLGYNADFSNSTIASKILQANAYILSMPGVPCVFYPHWVTFKNEIKAMINARYITGVHSESTVSEEVGNGYYKATVIGNNGEIRLLLGPNSTYNKTPTGYTLAIKGENYGVYYKVINAKEDKYHRGSKFYVSATCDSTCGFIIGQTGLFAKMTEHSFEATPNYGYHFVQWSDGNTDNPRTIILTQDTTLTAEFARNEYTIATESDNPIWGVTIGDTTALYMDQLSVEAIPNYGYHFVQWTDNIADNPRQFVLTQDTTFVAEFAKNIYTITLNAENGTIEGNTQAEYLDEVTLTAVSNFGYSFVQWSDNILTNPHTFVLTQDTTFTAEFSQDYSGQCGDNLYWDFEDNILHITGSGEMYVFTDSMIPWILLLEEIQSVDFSTGVTYIGDYAFAGVNNRKFTELVLPQGLLSIGNHTFEGDAHIETIDFGANLESIGDSAFNGCTRVVSMTCLAPSTPDVGKDGLTSISSNAELFVLASSIQKYSVDPNWSRFVIKEYKMEEGIYDIFDSSCPQVMKLLLDGQLLILRGDKVYTLQGEEVR